MNVPSIIRNKKSVDVNKVNNLEDNIVKLCESKNKSSLINDAGYLISVYDNLDLFDYIKPYEQLKIFLEKTNLIDIDEESVIIGDFLQKIFTTEDFETIKPISICHYNKIIDNKKYNCQVDLDSKIYQNSIHIILKQKNWFNKIGYSCGKVLISNSFLLEYLEKKKYINLFDSVLEKKYILFKNDDKYCLHDFVVKYDFYGVLNIKQKNYEEIIDGMLPIERALMLYSKERNIKLKYELKNIITILANHHYLRPPFIYFNYLEIDDDELKNIIHSIINKIKIESDASENYDKINKYIITNFIKSDNIDYFVEFVQTFKYTFDTDDHENILKYNSRNILKLLIKNDLIYKSDALSCILLIEALDMLEYLQIDKNDLVEKSKSILKEIIHKNKYVTFYYLYKLNNDIINYKFDGNNTIVHSLSNQSKDIIKLIFSLSNEISKSVNQYNQNILMTNIDKNIDIIMILMQYVNLLHSDNNNNNILHYIANNNRIDVLKYMLNDKVYKEIIINCIDQQNNKGETPIMLSTMTNNESLFYILYNLGANTNLNDENGNSIYHFICKNKMCIGFELKNQNNNFGFSPIDYANISSNYWKWI